LALELIHRLFIECPPETTRREELPLLTTQAAVS
jgi:hypothetical protein